MSQVIYKQVDPRDGKIRYVGRTKNFERRCKEHLTPSPGAMTKERCQWLHELRNLALKPGMEILEEVSDEEASWKETCWIQRLTDEGHELFNQFPAAQRRIQALHR